MIGGMNPPVPEPEPEPDPDPGPDWSSGGLGTTSIGLGGAVPGVLGPNSGGFDSDGGPGPGLGLEPGVPLPKPVPDGGLGSPKDGGGVGVMGGRGGGSWPSSGTEGVVVDGDVEVKGGVVDDGGAFGGLTQNGEPARLAASAASSLLAFASTAAGGGGRYAGSTVLMKLSLYSASIIRELLLLCLSALASAPRTMQANSVLILSKQTSEQRRQI